MTAKIDENGNGPAPSEQDVTKGARIGDVSKFSEANLDLDEVQGKIWRAKGSTTCSNIDTALDYINKAMEELERYFEWAERIEAIQNRATCIEFSAWDDELEAEFQEKYNK